MTTFHCVDSTNEYDVSLQLRDPDGNLSTDRLAATCDNFSGLDGFIITSGPDAMFPARYEGDFFTTQAQFDAFIAALKGDVERANAGEDTILYPLDGATWVIGIRDNGEQYFNLLPEEFSNEQLGYLFKHVAPWPDELIEELVNRAGLDYSECEEDSEDYWGVWIAAAEKLGIIHDLGF